MSNNEILRITIPNWQKYNPRSDRANYTWFRLDNNFFYDQAIFPLSDSSKMLYLFFLCEASKKNEATIELRVSYLTALLRTTSKQILEDFAALQENQLITSENCNQVTATCQPSDGEEPASLPATNVTNVTNVTNNIADSNVGDRVRLDFEKIYDEYPRKEGKQEGLKVCKVRIKTQAEFDTLLSAVRRYRAHCEREGIEKQFIKHFSSFLHKDRWKDWLDPETGTAIETKSGAKVDENYFDFLPKDRA